MIFVFFFFVKIMEQKPNEIFFYRDIHTHMHTSRANESGLYMNFWHLFPLIKPFLMYSHCVTINDDDDKSAFRKNTSRCEMLWIGDYEPTPRHQPKQAKKK